MYPVSILEGGWTVQCALPLGKSQEIRGESQGPRLPGDVHLLGCQQPRRKIPSVSANMTLSDMVPGLIRQSSEHGKLHEEKILWISASRLQIVEIAAYNFCPIISLLGFSSASTHKSWVSSSSSTSRSCGFRVPFPFNPVPTISREVWNTLPEAETSFLFFDFHHVL